jgi:hypothetical protein
MKNNQGEGNLLVVFSVEEYARKNEIPAFYTTIIKEQALQWGYNLYQRFSGDGMNRSSKVLSYNYDYVQGPVANDKIVLTITGFIDGLYRMLCNLSVS